MNEQELRALLNEMSLKEKLGQLTQVGAYFFSDETGTETTGPEEDLKLSKEDLKYVGSVLGCTKPETLRKLQPQFMELQPHHIPLLFMQDVIHGFRTIYPNPLGLSCSFDDELMRKCSEMAAKEASKVGVHVTFAPMADIARDARWGRCMESFGEDVTLSSRMAAATVKGFQGEGREDHIDACVKHFCAYGAGEAGRDYNTVELSERTLRQTYLPSYRAAVDAGVRYVMPSFNTIGNVPMTENGHLLVDVLRKEWGFDGITVSDYNAVREMVFHGAKESWKDAAEAAISAKCDIEMMSGTFYLHGEELIREGKIQEGDIDEAVYRILSAKNRLGLFENPCQFASMAEVENCLLSEEHRNLARKAAEESAVLLKNNGILPLKKNAGKIALVGPFGNEKGIKGAWFCDGRDEECVTILEGLQTLVPEADFISEKGCSYEFFPKPETLELEKALKAAKSAETVLLCIGEYQDYSGEGTSRATLTLPGDQMTLVREICKVNKNVVAVVFGGRPLELSELSELVSGLLYVWQPGTEGGNAIARLLYGEAVPCGKAAMTFPRSVGQEPIYYAHQRTARPVPDDSIVALNSPYTSRYLDVPVSPLYPFGYGLSYTEFSYGPVLLDRNTMKKGSGETLQASVTVKNAGNFPGKETVQLYLRDLVGSVARPVKELKDYQKIFLNPGEEKTVTFTVTEEMLKFWTKDMLYEAEPGKFTVFIGSDSRVEAGVDFVLESEI